MYPEPNTDSPARLSTRQTGSPGMIYTARYGSPKRQLQFYRVCRLIMSLYMITSKKHDMHLVSTRSQRAV
ncbi:hypothetical protein MHYP_G00077420 [Metynnis hypsauchen]